MVVKPEKVMVPELVIPVAPVIAPAAEMSKVGVFKKLVKPEPPEFVMRMASVTTVEPTVPVSALSRRRRADTAVSSTSPVNWFCTWKTYSVLPVAEELGF